ncbi:group III truncated hemoglobin [Catellatospora sp. KI3]|uniref:group III truncated hemoglobin n=1 Tax=Catellatospora sp. KI3 TaxID=3041620 RepID=UPI00248305E4|nr:group III truncated hemoglobin [Catellatospora sp. KI3]MDI1461221.1 group III truncated hemoglobin [Catellatospora sp. KI3]
MRDISGRDDIATLVETFYRRAFADPLLGPIFVDIVRMDLAAHLPTMVDFWETVLLHAKSYRGNTLQVHVALHERAPLRGDHFLRWLQLWHATLDDLFTGPVAELAKTQSTRMGWSLQRRLGGGTGSEFTTIGVRAGA